VRIAAAELQLDGQLAADGADDFYAENGAGGGIYVTVGTLSGGGAIHAAGGQNLNGAGRRGGGRVAVYAADSRGCDIAQIPALSAGYDGGSGTVYLRDTGEATGTLIIEDSRNLHSVGVTPLGMSGQTTFVIPDQVVIRGVRANVRSEHAGLVLE